MKASIDFSPLQQAGGVQLPSASLPRGGIVSRWSDLGVSAPAATATPRTEADVAACVAFAAAHGLRLVVGSGGHGVALPIDGGALYVDVRALDGVALDTEKGTVTLGGGVSTGAAMKELVRQGWYTAGPNTNQVGMAACALGGGSGLLNGTKGLMADLVVALRLVTADGKVLDLNATKSAGEERALFNALRGAGHGLGVVTSLTMRAFPLAELHLGGEKRDSAWVRRLAFPGTSDGVAAAAHAFEAMQRGAREVPKRSLVLIFARAPPTAPRPGAPVVMLSANYLGPAEEGEACCAQLFDKDVVDKAVSAETALVPLDRLNDSSEPLNRHGGFKTSYSAFVRRLTADTIAAGFDRWLRVGDECAAGRPSFVVVGGWSTAALEANGAAGGSGEGTYMESRDRGTVFFAYNWWLDEQATEYMNNYGNEMLKLHRRDDGAADPPRSFPNNLRFDMALDELHTKDKVAELKRIKKLWDPQDLFWSPYSEKV